jgi:hypothetical protein
MSGCCIVWMSECLDVWDILNLLRQEAVDGFGWRPKLGEYDAIARGRKVNPAGEEPHEE